MSSEEEKVSKAFLQSVLSAEAADAEEPEEMPDPEADRILAKQLADKYAVHPKAAPWFRRPAWVAGMGAAVAAAAAVAVLLRPVEPVAPTLTAFALNAEPETNNLGDPPAANVIRLHEHARWKLPLRAQTPLDGEVKTIGFITRGGEVEQLHELPQEQMGSLIDVRLSGAMLPQGSGTADLYLVTCRSEHVPTKRQLIDAIRAISAWPAGRSVRLSSGDCQCNHLTVERSDEASK
jgi:hypothetical protein